MRGLRPLVTRSQIVVNTRSLTAGLSGVQRYVGELCGHLNGRLVSTSPARPMRGFGGHLWEQVILPTTLGRRLLWSPANSGPVLVERQVVTVHDVACLDHPEWFSGNFARWYRRMVPLLVKRARRVIAVSEFTKRRIVAVAGIDGSKIDVVPNGVAERFKPSAGEAVEQVRRDLGIPSGRYILSLGTLEPRKNIERQFRAWSLCLSRLSADVSLVVAGARGRRQVFGDVKVDQLPPRVHVTGFVPDDNLPALYAGCSALLYPSIYEGFGLPPLEAMASGAVVIASHSGALPEVVGDAGILIDPYDPSAIADAILGLVTNEDLRNRLSARAIARSQLYSWRRTSEMTWRVLQDAAEISVAEESFEPEGSANHGYRTRK